MNYDYCLLQLGTFCELETARGVFVSKCKTSYAFLGTAQSVLSQKEFHVVLEQGRILEGAIAPPESVFKESIIHTSNFFNVYHFLTKTNKLTILIFHINVGYKIRMRDNKNYRITY